MKKIIVCACLLALPLLSTAQELPLDKKQLLKDIEFLSSDEMEGRLSGSKGNKMAQEYILGRFTAIGLEAFNGSYKQHFRIENKKLLVEQATNLIGYIPGKSDLAIVVTAHYDHVGQRNGQVYNGADDNASGIGALLAAASYFMEHPPKHTLVFVALDGEELGLQGANAFLENPPIPLERIALNVNMDMLSVNSKGELYASGAFHYPKLEPYLLQVGARPNARLILGHDRPEQGHNDWTGQSDHFQFHKRQIPFVYFGVEDHPYYHQPTDDFINTNTTFYPEAAALVIDFIKVADANLQDIQPVK
ncbi:M28 family peptidase [Pontibacter locisalis]|uniref:M28 family peptidase n=1 Tax=Pontibacter locisalis TaxID=1719035 RepID=A0ABW5IQM8_9BACT